MTVEQVIEEFDKVLGVEGYCLMIFTYPKYPGSRDDAFSGEPKFHSYRYHLLASPGLSSRHNGIHHKNDDLVKGITNIIEYAKSNAEEVFKPENTVTFDHIIAPEPPEYPREEE